MSDNNMSEQNIEICTHQLMEIGNALNAYRKEHGDFPMWLSNLHPEYLKDKKLLICPADRSAGSPAFSSNKDPELPVSYDYQLTPSYREWKSDQCRIYGDIVPLIRCRHHASDDRKDFVINLSHALEIYESSGIWERHPRVLDNLLGNLKRYISERSLEGQTNIGRRTHRLVSTLTEDQQTELRVLVEKTIQSQPENGTAYKILGVLQVVKGDELGALDTFAQAMPMLQHDAETHSIAGELYSKHNRIEEAIDAFEMVLQLLPQDRGVFPRLTHLYVQSGRHKDGEALISRFKSIMRDDGPSDGLILSNMLMEVKRYEEAREVAENVLAKEPENREALSMLAEIHEALGNADLAREYQIKLDPTIAWIGKAAPEFSAKDLDGNPISLKDYRGKIVLLDFWAVWCGPCVEEMPNVKKVYEEYHDRDFDIIGISLDTSEEKLRSFIRDREIPWRQIFSGKGWNSPVSRMYGIRAIPAPWLIDRDGRVISTRARGSRLEQLVAEAVGEKVGSSARRIP